MKIRTHYDNLQIARNASAEVVRAAYKGLAQRYHPDRNPGDHERCERIMRLLNEALAVLSDPLKRAEHDAWIADQELSEQAGSDQVKPAYEHSPFTTQSAAADYETAANAWRESRQSAGDGSENGRPRNGTASGSRQDKESLGVPEPMSAWKGLAIAVFAVIAMLIAMQWGDSGSRAAFYVVGAIVGAAGAGAVLVHIRNLRDNGNEKAAAKELGALLTLLVWGWLPLSANALVGGGLTAEVVAILAGAYLPAWVAARALLTRSVPDLRWIEVAGCLLLMVGVFALARLFLAPATSVDSLSQHGGSVNPPPTFFIVALGIVLWTVFLLGVGAVGTVVLAGIDRVRGRTTAKPRAIGLLVGWGAMPALALWVFSTNLFD